MNQLISVMFLSAASTLLAEDGSTMLWYDTPASGFHESAPLGNGRLGAMVFGGMDEDRIVLNEPRIRSWKADEARKYVM